MPQFFVPERRPPKQEAPATPDQRRLSPLALTALALVAIGVGAFFILRTGNANTPIPDSRQAQLQVDSNPPGAQVILNGQPRGITPVTLVLDAGTYSMVLRRGAEERTVPVQLGNGAQVHEYFDFAPSNPPAIASGKAPVVTDPPRTRVIAGGQARGSAPASTPGAGWLIVSTPFETQIHEADALLGTSLVSKLMLPAGRHEIVLDNQTVGYRESRRIEIVAGRTTTVRVDPPKARLSANAQPWADVFMDGKIVGQTPLANIEVPIGMHEVIFRHPQLGERKQTVIVTARGPNRITVDLREKR